MTYLIEKLANEFENKTPVPHAHKRSNQYVRQKCNKVPGSSRKEWISPDGALLHYRNIYLKPYTWAMLADLARNQGISGSEAVERLIAKAAGYDIAIPR